MSIINETKQGSIQLVNGRGTISYDIVSPKTNTQGVVNCTVDSPMNLTKTNDIDFDVLGSGGAVSPYGPKLVGPPTDTIAINFNEYTGGSDGRGILFWYQSYMGPLDEPLRIKIDGIEGRPDAYLDIPITLDPDTNTFSTTGTGKYVAPSQLTGTYTIQAVGYPETLQRRNIAKFMTEIKVHTTMVITMELLDNDGTMTPGEALFARISWRNATGTIVAPIEIIAHSTVPAPGILFPFVIATTTRNDRIAANGTEVVRIPIPVDLAAEYTNINLIARCMDAGAGFYKDAQPISLTVKRD